MVYLSYNLNNFILPVNTVLRKKEPKIECKRPENIAINPVTNMVYVSSTDKICIIDGETNLVKGCLGDGTSRSRGAVEIDVTTNTLYTTCFGTNILTVIDATNGSTLAKVEVGKEPRGISIDTVSKKIYVANSGSNSISVVDEQSNKVVDTFKIESGSAAAGKMPEFLVADPFTKQLYVQYCDIVGTEGQAVFVLSILVIYMIKKTIISRRQLYSSPATPPTEGLAFAFNINNKAHYTCRRASNTVLVLDTDGKKVLNKIVLDKGKFWKKILSHIFAFAEPIAIDTKTNKVYVTDSSKNLLYEING